MPSKAATILVDSQYTGAVVPKHGRLRCGFGPLFGCTCRYGGVCNAFHLPIAVLPHGNDDG